MKTTMLIAIFVESKPGDETVPHQAGSEVEKKRSDQTAERGTTEWRDPRPPMNPRFQNRHQEYLASAALPKEWYGVL